MRNYTYRKHKNDAHPFAIVCMQTIKYFPVLLPAMAYLYDYIYFIQLGIQVDQIPSTFFDHLRSALNWLPEISLYSLFNFALILCFIRNNKEEEPNNKTRVISFIILLPAIISFLAAILFELSYPYVILYMTIIISLLTSFIYFIENSKTYREALSNQIRTGIRSFLALLTITLSLSLYQGKYDYYQLKTGTEKFKTKIIIKDYKNINPKEQSYKEEVLVRPLEAGVIWYNRSNNSFNFSKWDYIEEINFPNKRPLSSNIKNPPNNTNTTQIK
ncbi:hypothetical protein I862_03905 [endosymbiont of Acanthamoeba sp. UWC8]|uniref:hypothetical protein n=1 Tax=endosymbiont of Acanthamoeba sp. UWC8 TaxID=86106 RepID=UPI0004D0BFF4|nr:hypothetical protein [endosymbiont of Acanthamoeba sp. UWC8]AIF81341.1 hypothetical protein I862_03905 [endosymbiont of Acanthamoeba sp. UWC8]